MTTPAALFNSSNNIGDILGLHHFEPFSLDLGFLDSLPSLAFYEDVPPPTINLYPYRPRSSSANRRPNRTQIRYLNGFDGGGRLQAKPLFESIETNVSLNPKKCIIVLMGTGEFLNAGESDYGATV